MQMATQSSLALAANSCCVAGIFFSPVRTSPCLDLGCAGFGLFCIGFLGIGLKVTEAKTHRLKCWARFLQLRELRIAIVHSWSFSAPGRRLHRFSLTGD